MRILLDECLPRKLKSQLPGHEVLTVPEAGWAGKSNGELLALIPGEFEVFVTIDQNLAHQQRLSGLPFATVVLSAPSNSFADLLPLAPALRQVLEDVSPGDSTTVS